MKNILLITSRDVIDEVGKATSVGAATLIYKRATAFYQNYKYTTFILPLNGAVKTKSTGHLGSEYINYKNMSSKKSIEKFIRSKHPKIIIFSGEKSYLYHSNVRKLIKKENLNSELILDLHGALEEDIEHSSGIASIFAYFRYIIKKSLYKSVAKESESLLVVSDELAKHSIKLLPDNRNDKNIYKIRTCQNWQVRILLEGKCKCVFKHSGDLVFRAKLRTAGMRTNATHGQVNTDINKVIFLQLKGMCTIPKLCGGIGIY